LHSSLSLRIFVYRVFFFVVVVVVFIVSFSGLVMKVMLVLKNEFGMVHSFSDLWNSLRIVGVRPFKNK
jgi:hypothetical protein